MPCPGGGHHEQDGTPLPGSLSPPGPRWWHLPRVDSSITTGVHRGCAWGFLDGQVKLYFFSYFLLFSKPGTVCVCVCVPPLSPCWGLAAETVPVVPVPGAAFGNGRTHTGAVAGSGGSRLANYSPGEPPRTRAPGTHGCSRAPHASPPPTQGSAAGLGGGARGGPAPSRMDLGGHLVGFCAHVVQGGGDGDAEPHPEKVVQHPRVSPWVGGGQGSAGYRSLEQRGCVSPCDSGFLGLIRPRNAGRASGGGGRGWIRWPSPAPSPGSGPDPAPSFWEGGGGGETEAPVKQLAVAAATCPLPVPGCRRDGDSF